MVCPDFLPEMSTIKKKKMRDERKANELYEAI